MLKLQGRFPLDLRLHRFILCTRCSGGTAHEGEGCDQSIKPTVSDEIFHLAYAVVVDCMELGVPHWATSVVYCK